MPNEQTELPHASVPGLRTIELKSGDEPALQRFFEDNPEYFLAVQGEPARPGEGYAEIHDEVPAGWSFTQKWVLGYVDADDRLVAMANVVSDLLAVGVWHIGLFIVATARHGRGDARPIIEALEDWARAHGANWLRLGVAQGNERAERFWQKLGFMQVRVREGVEVGVRRNTVRVLVKPLATGDLKQYLDLVPRDQPDVQAEVERGDAVDGSPDRRRHGIEHIASEGDVCEPRND